MAIYLSKDWPLARVLGILRITVNEIAPDKLQDLDLIDMLHLVICDISELLGESVYKDYGKRIKIWFQPTQPTAEQINDIWINTGASNKQYYWDGTSWIANINALTLSANIIDLSNHRVSSITKLVDDVLAATVNGLCIEVDQKEFDALVNIPQKQSNVYYTRFGERLYIYDGANITTRVSPYSMHLFYNIVPLKITNMLDTVDIRDKYMKLVVDKAKVMIYENLLEIPPESLTNTINNSVELIRQSNLAELSIVKNRVKVTKNEGGN